MSEKKKPIEQYDHKRNKRINNPPVGHVTPETECRGLYTVTCDAT